MTVGATGTDALSRDDAEAPEAARSHVERLIATVGDDSPTLERALWHAVVALRAIATGESCDVAAVALQRVEHQLARRR